METTLIGFNRTTTEGFLHMCAHFEMPHIDAKALFIKSQSFADHLFIQNKAFFCYFDRVHVHSRLRRVDTAVQFVDHAALYK